MGGNGMNVIYWPTQWGKTTALVEMARANGGVVIAKSDASKKYIRGKWSDVDVYTFEEMLNGELKTCEKPLYIDDADETLRNFIEGYAPGEIGGISLTMKRPF
jgi:hypothetical protein